MSDVDRAEIKMEAIAYVHSCFREKFGTPRQAGLVPAALGRIDVLPEYSRPEAFAELQGFSHLWVLFIFHQVADTPWSATVRPPRLGGNKKVGVFASRSPFRPNSIGLSLVKLERMENHKGQIRLHVSGLDMIEGTPVVDIKPYLPWADQRDDACGGFAARPPETHQRISFSALAEQQLGQMQRGVQFKALICEVLQQDPRPAYRQKSDDRTEYGINISGYNVRWHQQDAVAEVFQIECLDASGPTG